MEFQDSARFLMKFSLTNINLANEDICQQVVQVLILKPYL